MIAVESGAVPAPEWEARVAACGGNPLHLPALHFAEHDPERLIQLQFRHGSDVVACAVGFGLSRRVWRFALRPHVLLFPTAPAIARTELARDVHAALVAFARDRGFGRLVVQPASSPGLTAVDFLAPYASGALVEFVLDLTREPEEIRMGMHKIHRKNVRRARASGLVVQEDSSLDGLLRLREMQLVSSQRAAEREHGFAVRDAGWFRRLHEHVYAAGVGHVLFARQGDEPVAALAYAAAARRALTVRSGSLPQGYETRAMYLLYDELIHTLQAQGVVELNLGGVPHGAADPTHPQFGLHEFKAGFGGAACIRAGVDVPLRQVAP